MDCRRKKYLAIALSLIFVLALGGCGNNKGNTNSSVKNNSAVENTTNDVNKDDNKTEKEKNISDEIIWDEITADGVDEELLLKNIDKETLNTVATELQTLVTEEAEEERKNPEIAITEGWTRVFKSDRYKNVVAWGQVAMKPLYFILYKSPNAGQYEYICAQALYDLSGCDFEWSNAKEFLEEFNKQIIGEKY